MAEKFTAKAEILIKATPARVWEGLTNPELVKEYLFGTQMKTDWQVGSPISYTGVWEGKPYEDKGQVLQIEKEKLIVSSYWSGFFGLPDLPENYQIVTYQLSPEAEGTKLTVIQEGSKTQESADHSGDNWQMVLGKMKELLEK